MLSSFCSLSFLYFVAPSCHWPDYNAVWVILEYIYIQTLIYIYIIYIYIWSYMYSLDIWGYGDAVMPFLSSRLYLPRFVDSICHRLCGKISNSYNWINWINLPITYTRSLAPDCNFERTELEVPCFYFSVFFHRCPMFHQFHPSMRKSSQLHAQLTATQHSSPRLAVSHLLSWADKGWQGNPAGGYQMRW
jgi:hypothetical protein